MKKIKENLITMGTKKIPISIYKLENNEMLSSVSRVYVIGADKNGNVPLVFNSKRNIWGFPGGHTEPKETIEQTAYREFAEEARLAITNCTRRYLISSRLDGDMEEKQVICFCLIEGSEEKITDATETVTKVKLVPITEVLTTIGNQELWENIVQDFEEWFSYLNIGK